MPSMTLAIEASDVRKVYHPGRRNEIVALAGLDLQVRAGDVFGFVGPNGAGKTTTVKILTGLAWPTSGSARILGELAGTVAARTNLGYLPEVASYHEFMAVGELLSVHARLAGMPGADVKRACDDALEAVRLTDRRGSRLRELSKGMQQRFGIAQAMVARPRLLILDEPTSGLDPLSQKEVKDIIVSLKSQGITIFFSSHKLTEVEHICDHIGIIHRGCLLRAAPLQDLLSPDDRVVVRFHAEAAALEALRAAGYSPVPDDDGHRIEVPGAQTDAVVDAVRANRGHLRSVEQARVSLEDAFFSLVTEADAA